VSRDFVPGIRYSTPYFVKFFTKVVFFEAGSKLTWNACTFLCVFIKKSLICYVYLYKMSQKEGISPGNREIFCINSGICFEKQTEEVAIKIETVIIRTVRTSQNVQEGNQR
jgi:hypothetical protein